MNAIEENEFVEGWRHTAASLPKVNAVLCISAHWETRGTYVTDMDWPRTIHDFGGFPRELYEVMYPAKGSPPLANEIMGRLSKVAVAADLRWGLDHGCWSVLKHFYPEANIPVIEMSLDYGLTPSAHFELARELSFLRSKGVLIVGSGNMVHNLRMVAWDKMNEAGFGYDWALEANEKMKKYILEGSFNELIHYSSQGRAFNLAIPTPDHFLPLLYVLALKEENDSIDFFNDKAVAGSLTMTSLKIA